MTSFAHKTARVMLPLLVVGLVAPASFFAAPQPAHADAIPTIEVGPVLPTTFLNQIENTINEISTITNTAANFAQKINTYVLEPLAYVTSGNLLKSITAGVLKFVGGITNGTGQPQFVQNIMGHLQGVGDTQALSFFTQFSAISNSPFAPAVTSSLRRNYFQGTSLAGFFAQNQCTLDTVSSDVTAYVTGSWSKGGWNAWFSLTTKQENNPYTLYQNTQNKLVNQVADAASARLTELNWGQGFLSWCGPDTSVSTASGGNGKSTTPSTTATANGSNTTQDSSVVDSYTYNSSVGNAAGDACTNADGSPGTITTPGSLIKDELSKALGLDWDKLVNTGNIGPEINSIMKDIGTVANTIGTASSILSDVNGGLAGIGGSSQFADYQTRAGYLGITDNTVINDSSTNADTWQSAAQRVTDYETAWNTITNSANVASTSLATVTSACDASNNFQKPGFAQKAATYVTAAAQAQTNLVNPIFASAAAASSSIAADRVLIARIQAAQNSTTPGAGGTYGADVQALQAAPPTVADLVHTQTEASGGYGLSGDTASASPSGSLNISGGSMVGRMNLITTNATAMAAECDDAKKLNYTP